MNILLQISFLHLSSQSKLLLGIINPSNENLLTKIFGKSDWKQYIYEESAQLSFFDDPALEKISGGLKQYIQSRLEETFPTVAPNPALLCNENNSPLFLLCFAGSNPDNKAKKLAIKGAEYILNNV